MIHTESIDEVDLGQSYSELVQGLVALNKRIEDRLNLLQEKQDKYDAVCSKVSVNQLASQRKVELNVGGRTFACDKETFRKAEGSYFHALLCEDVWAPNQ